MFVPAVVGLCGMATIESLKALKVIPGGLLSWISALVMTYVIGIWQLGLWWLAVYMARGHVNVVQWVFVGIAALAPISSMVRHRYDLKNPRFLFLDRAVTIFSYTGCLPFILQIWMSGLSQNIWPFISL